MVNQEYWDFVAEQYEQLNMEEIIKNTPSHLMGQNAYILFEHAVAMFMTGRDPKGSELLKKSWDCLEITQQALMESRYEKLRILIKWLQKNTVDSNSIKHLTYLKQRELCNQVIFYQNKVLVTAYRKCKLPKIDEEKDLEQIQSSFRDRIRDFYSIRNFADHLVELVKYLALKGTYLSTKPIINELQTLYAMVLKTIPIILSRKKKKWKPLESLSDAQIKEKFSDEYEEYLEERSLLRGSLPFYRRQAEILLSFNSAQMKRGVFQDTKDKLDLFFSDHINPPNKSMSNMSIADELFWVIIKQIFLREGTMPSAAFNQIEYMKENLG